jgi:hypothetical protein
MCCFWAITESLRLRRLWPKAFDDLYFVERAAQTQILAMSTGRPLARLTSGLIEQVAAQTRYERFELGYIERHFAAQKRLLDASGGLYRN